MLQNTGHPQNKNPRLDQIRDTTKMIRDGEDRQTAGECAAGRGMVPFWQHHFREAAEMMLPVFALWVICRRTGRPSGSGRP